MHIIAMGKARDNCQMTVQMYPLIRVISLANNYLRRNHIDNHTEHTQQDIEQEHIEFKENADDTV